MRNIEKDVYKDIWMQSQDHAHCLAWLMLIISTCDDQGRFEMHPSRLRARLFFGDPKITDDYIKSVINDFVSAKKVVQYEVDGKLYCQIVNWWKYQQKSSHMTVSKFPAPKNWIDRFYYTGKGRKPIKSLYWEEGLAGFVDPDLLPDKSKPPVNP